MADFLLYVFNQKYSKSELNLSFLDHLSDAVLEKDHELGKTRIFTITGSSLESLKLALFEHSGKFAFDYCILPRQHHYGPFKLAVFDMDSTLIPMEVIDELAVQAGVGKQVAEITKAAMRGELDFNQSLEQRVRQLEGLSDEAVGTVKSQLQFNPGVESFCHFILQQGGQIAIASGGFMPFAEELAQRLPFIKVRANQLIYQNGALTGQVEHPIVNADVKAASLQEWASEAGLLQRHCIAVGDGANDLKMLQKAGIGVAYKAKPTLGKSADCVLNVGSLDSLVDVLPIIEQYHGASN